MAETIYKHCKKLIKKKEGKTNQPIKIKIPLRRWHQKLLLYWNMLLKYQLNTVSLILFIQTSTLISKYVLRREPVKNQVVFSFNNKTDLAEILGLIKHFETSRQPIELWRWVKFDFFSFFLFPLCTVFHWCAKKADYY